MAQDNQSHLNGHSLANLSDYFRKMYDQWEEDNRRNKGYVWTVNIDDTTTLKAIGLMTVDYDLKLSCSHVGESMFGVYRGSIAFKFHGDNSGMKMVLGVLGMKTSEDFDGWFRNDDFIMNIRKYDEEDEQQFLETFDTHPTQQKPEATGDPVTDAARQAGYDYANNLINSIMGAVYNRQESAYEKKDAPTGMGYDWDTHMTEGDLGEFFNVNGGLFFWANAHSETDSHYTNLTGDVKVMTLLGNYYDNIDEQITSPFPHTLKLYPDGTARFTIYNYKDTIIPAVFNGTFDCIDVKDTTVVKP